MSRDKKKPFWIVNEKSVQVLKQVLGRKEYWFETYVIHGRGNGLMININNKAGSKTFNLVMKVFIPERAEHLFEEVEGVIHKTMQKNINNGYPS